MKQTTIVGIDYSLTSPCVCINDGKKIMFYVMKEYFIKDPPKSYIDVINDGYKDCNIDLRIHYKF